MAGGSLSLESTPKRRPAFDWRTLQDGRAASLQMVDKPLGGDPRHRYGCVVDALADLKTQRAYRTMTVALGDSARLHCQPFRDGIAQGLPIRLDVTGRAKMVNLYVGITDYDWFRFLAALPSVEEVNFWQPGGRTNFRALRSGELFLFKLHAPETSLWAQVCLPVLKFCRLR